MHEFLAIHLSYNRKKSKACGLSRVPSRRTYDGSLTIISGDIKNRITTMGDFFVREKIVGSSILSRTDSKHSIHSFMSVEYIQFIEYIQFMLEILRHI